MDNFTKWHLSTFGTLSHWEIVAPPSPELLLRIQIPTKSNLFYDSEFRFFFSSDGYFLFFYSRAFKLFQQVGAKWSNEQKTFLTDRERGLKRSLLSQSGLSWNPRWPLTLYGDLTGNTHLTSELRWAFPDAYAYMPLVIYAFNYSQKVESFQRT